MNFIPSMRPRCRSRGCAQRQRDSREPCAAVEIANWHHAADGHNLFKVETCPRAHPRVAPCCPAQPWALLRNRFAIRRRTRSGPCFGTASRQGGAALTGSLLKTPERRGRHAVYRFPPEFGDNSCARA